MKKVLKIIESIVGKIVRSYNRAYCIQRLNASFSAKY